MKHISKFDKYLKLYEKVDYTKKSTYTDPRVLMTNYINKNGLENVYISFRSQDFDSLLSHKMVNSSYTGVPGLYCFKLSSWIHLFYRDGVVKSENFEFDFNSAAKDNKGGGQPLDLKYMGLGFSQDWTKFREVEYQGVFKYIVLFTLENYTKFNERTGDIPTDRAIYNFFLYYSHLYQKNTSLETSEVNLSSIEGKNKYEKLLNYYKTIGLEPYLLKKLCLNKERNFLDLYYTIKKVMGSLFNLACQKKGWKMIRYILTKIGVYVMDQIDVPFLHYAPDKQTLVLTDKAIKNHIKLDLSKMERNIHIKAVDVVSSILKSSKVGDSVKLGKYAPFKVLEIDGSKYKTSMIRGGHCIFDIKSKTFTTFDDNGNLKSKDIPFSKSFKD